MLIVKTYVPEVNPKLDLTGMTLEDVLCHIRIVGNRLYCFGVRRKKLSKKLSFLHQRQRAGRHPATTARSELLFLKLYTTRQLHSKQTSLLQRLHKNLKARTKEGRPKLPPQVFVSMDAPPILVYNRYAILADHESPTQTKG